MKILKFKKIKLGEFIANQFTIIEIKNLFSFIVYYFKGDGWQDRYHSHAFNAIAINLFGNIQEEILDNNKTKIEIRNEWIKYYSKERYHKLGKSKGCLMIVICGPWEKYWYEIKDGIKRKLSWKRVQIISV